MEIPHHIKTPRWSIPVSIGLSVAAVRVTLLPRAWALLALGLAADKAANELTGLHRHEIARRWAKQLFEVLPTAFHEFAEKAWVGPLGLISPFMRLMESQNWIEAAWALAGILSTITIWGFFGSAICRVALCRMTQKTMPGLQESLKYTFNQRQAIFGALVSLLLLIGMFTAINCGMGLLAHLPIVGPLLAWVLVPLSIIPASIIVLAVIGAILGWPLVLGVAMAEDADMFETVSRSQAYVFQAPVVYALTFKVGFIVQAVGYWFVRGVCWGLITILNACFGLFGWFPNALAQNPSLALPEPWTVPDLSGNALTGWASIITHLAACWPICYSFAFAGGLYLALRLNVDGTPLTDLFLPSVPVANPDEPTVNTSSIS